MPRLLRADSSRVEHRGHGAVKIALQAKTRLRMFGDRMSTLPHCLPDRQLVARVSWDLLPRLSFGFSPSAVTVMNVLSLVHRSGRSPGPAFVFAETSDLLLARVVGCGSTAPGAAVAAFANSLADYPAESQAGPRIRPAGLINETMSRPGRCVETWLAWGALAEEDNATPVGLVTLVRAYRGDQTRHSIGWLLVHPDARRRGLGRMLVATALAAADCQAAREVWVETKAHWTAAIRFWRACGFAEPARPISESPA